MKGCPGYYQDHGVKFAHFVPLPDKKARTVAEALLKIFSIQGAPVFLQSDNGREFVNSIFEEFKVMWPGLKIIHGRPRHSQSQGSVERLNQTAERMLQKWCADTGKGWVAACIHVQWGYNTGHHSGVGNYLVTIFHLRLLKVLLMRRLWKYPYR